MGQLEKGQDLAWIQTSTNALGAMAVNGTQNGEDFIATGYSQGRSWALPSGNLTKDELETWHLGQINADHFCGTGMRFVPGEWKKTERPDFLLNIPEGEERLGVELSAFTVQERRAMEATARRLRKELEKQAARFAYLAGCRVMLGVETGHGPASVARINKEFANAERWLAVIEKLVRPSTLSLLSQFEHGFPEKLPLGILTEAKEGNIVASCQEHIAADIAKAYPQTSLPSLDMVFGVNMTVSELHAEMQSRISDHDYNGVDVLVLTAGAPDGTGMGYLEDELLLEFLLKNLSKMATFNIVHIKRVVAHYWSNGKLVQIFPHVQELVPPIADSCRNQTVVIWDAATDRFRGYRPHAWVL
jgi:hypothetical protein